MWKLNRYESDHFCYHKRKNRTDYSAINILQCLTVLRQAKSLANTQKADSNKTNAKSFLLLSTLKQTFAGPNRNFQPVVQIKDQLQNTLSI